jgi:hypothetical protein
LRKRRVLAPLLLPVLLLLAIPASSQAFITGIGDEQAQMFASPLFQALHVKIARYIIPYDAMERSSDRTAVETWVAAAQAQNIRPLIAFWHSGTSPNRVPSVELYQREVKKFVAHFPGITDYQPWDEANRGTVNSPTVQFQSPSAKQAAGFYEALRKVCRGCKIVGLDVLDSQNIKSTLRYIKQFKHYVRHMPSIWGLHNYTDTNRFRNKGTKAVAKAVPGQLWLTETGGLVQFGRSFPNRGGSGERRAANALRYMFRLAASNHKIQRLYIFQWTGSPPDARFDAGLVGPSGDPRPGYQVVASYLASHP